MSLLNSASVLSWGAFNSGGLEPTEAFLAHMSGTSCRSITSMTPSLARYLAPIHLMASLKAMCYGRFGD